MSTPGNSKRCTAKRAISSSVRRSRIGTLSKLRRERTSLRVSSRSSAGSTPISMSRFERGVDVGHALAHQLELERRAILGEHRAVAIEDEAALRGQRLDAHAVALRELGVIVVAHHLQHHEAADEHDGERDDDEGGGQRALLEQPLLGPVILDADRAHVLVRLTTRVRAADQQRDERPQHGADHRLDPAPRRRRPHGRSSPRCPRRRTR